MRSLLDKMQVRPPGTPLAQVAGGMAIAASSPPAKAVEASKANTNPLTKMEDMDRMGMILPWPRILRERTMGPRTFGCTGPISLPALLRRNAPVLGGAALRALRWRLFILMRVLAPELPDPSFPRTIQLAIQRHLSRTSDSFDLASLNSASTARSLAPCRSSHRNQLPPRTAAHRPWPAQNAPACRSETCPLPALSSRR